MNLSIATTLLVGLTLALAACDEDDGGSSKVAETGGSESDASGEPGDGDDGTTPCNPGNTFEVTCAAGQYCADPVFSECANGCLSNDNCASDQTCIKADGEDAGSCQNDEAPAEGPSLEEFCAKVMACSEVADMPFDMSMCETVYDSTNAECHECLIGANCNDDDVCIEECSL